MENELVNALANLKEKAALEITRKRLDAGDDPMSILEDARNALKIVGERFAASEYFIPDLVYSGEILKGISELVKPQLSKGPGVKRFGRVVFGTVAGDIHDLGKNIVTFMLDIHGFEVFDLGIDVPAQRFVEKLKETKAPVLGLSGFLTFAFDSMKETITAVKEAGLRDTVRIMIGGGQVDDEIRRYTGADAYGDDAMAAVTLATKWLVTGSNGGDK